MADAATATLVLKIISDVSGATKGLEETASATEKATGAVKGMALPALAVAGALGAMALAAAADETEQRKLETAIAAAGAATATSTQQVNDAIAASQARAFSDSETRDALQSLVTATGDVESATSLLATAQDVARFAGVDLATASDALAKATAGSDGALAKLIPGLQKGATATDTIANAQKAAAGQADLYAQSTEGSLAISADAFGELSETIGSAFLPIIKEMTGILTAVVKVLQDNQGLVKAVAVVIGILAAAILGANIVLAIYSGLQTAVSVATGIWTAAQWLLNAALNANPIGLVVLAILALVAILAVAWAKSETFRNIVTGVFKAVQTVVEAVIGVIKGIFENLSDILVKPFDIFLEAAKRVIGAVEALFKGLADAIGAIIGGISGALKGIGDAINSLPKLPSVFAAPPPGGGAPSLLLPGARTARGATGTAGGSVIVNVYGGDPRRVMEAVRAGYRRWVETSGKNAPSRDF